MKHPMAGPTLRLLPPLALFVGVLLFGVALLALGIEAAGEEPEPFDPSILTSANGTAILVYPIKSYGIGSTRIEVSFAFPREAGDAYVVGCRDLEALQRGDAPARPLLAFTQQQEGRFVVSRQTLPADYDPGPVPDPDTGLPRACEAAVAFRWSTADGNATENQPAASVALHRTPFDAGRHWVLLVLMSVGATLALLGGLAWARPRDAAARPPDSDDGPLEVLRASLDRLGSQLERTRRHLLLAGLLGVLLWYPVLVPWTWKQAQRSVDHPLFPWAVGGLTLTFLLILTGLWAKELHRLDRELASWRARMRELRDREDHLLERL